jgi:hypothetical protein
MSLQHMICGLLAVKPRPVSGGFAGCSTCAIYLLLQHGTGTWGYPLYAPARRLPCLMPMPAGMPLSWHSQGEQHGSRAAGLEAVGLH